MTAAAINAVLVTSHRHADTNTARTEANGNLVDSDVVAGDDFLARERAALGDDATQFTTSNDKAAFVDDDNDDLLGGGSGAQGGEDIEEFQSSFPAIDNSIEVCSNYAHFEKARLNDTGEHRRRTTRIQLICTTIQRTRARSDSRMARTTRSSAARPCRKVGIQEARNSQGCAKEHR